MMRAALVMLLFFCVSTAAYADGGQVLLQRDSGDLTVTLFAAPQPISTGIVDFSVLVQDHVVRQVELNDSVRLSLVSPLGAAQIVLLSHENASNKLLQAGSVSLKDAGRWHGTIEIHGPEGGAAFPIEFVVAAGYPRRATLFIFVLIPVLLIVLFYISRLRVKPDATEPGMRSSA